uniref:Carboxylic ester hydrolase n=1 Tax=Streltzoviella insularis TaxID=1206366 RepID=A0A7D5YS09_9NEOP|nr:carboxylesterase 14 [Streltzoviella insularis]
MVKVKVNEGELEGEVIENVLGGSYYSFKGIPYAEPPVGDLRFKEPQPVKPWNGVRSAKEHGPICYQYDMFSQTIRHEGSEDCLYLNVYTPDLNPSEPLAVMFWIHGGGFASGSGNTDYYGPDFLVKNNVILVTINYRLAVLGFLCLDTKEVPGNAGMKDQVAALRWVKKNISNFGGDPNNITIFGESAGAASVTYHLVSPMTEGLFKRAIVQSGSNLSEWATAFEPRLRAEALARQLGNETRDDKELYEFFKSVPKEQLVAVQTPITTEEEAGFKLTLNFSVANEKEFDGSERYFYGDVYERLCSGIHEGVEVIIGYTTHEGIVNFALLPNVFENFNKYLQAFVPFPMISDCSKRAQLEIGRKMKNYYFHNEKITKENAIALVKFLGTILVAYDLLQWTKICSKTNTNKLYLYKFDCYSERNIFVEIFRTGEFAGRTKIVSHCDDLMYIFHMRDCPPDVNSNSYKMIQNTTKLWTSFAKFGNPTPDNSLGVNWPVFDLNNQTYLHIGEELELASHPEKEEIEFWESIYKKYLPHKYYL